MCVCRERERRAGSACGAQLASFIWSAGTMSTEGEQADGVLPEGGVEVLKWMNESIRVGG